jgi:hypothetical protein
VSGGAGGHTHCTLYTGQCPCPPPGSRGKHVRTLPRAPAFRKHFGWLAPPSLRSVARAAPRGVSVAWPVRRLSLHPATLLRHARARSKRLPPLLPPHSYPAYGLLIIQNAGWRWTWGSCGIPAPHLPLMRTYIPSVGARFAPCVSGGRTRVVPSASPPSFQPLPAWLVS